MFSMKFGRITCISITLFKCFCTFCCQIHVEERNTANIMVLVQVYEIFMKGQTPSGSKKVCWIFSMVPFEMRDKWLYSNLSLPFSASVFEMFSELVKCSRWCSSTISWARRIKDEVYLMVIAFLISSQKSNKIILTSYFSTRSGYRCVLYLLWLSSTAVL